MARTLTRSASSPSFLGGNWMAVLFIILAVVIGLSVRAGLYGRVWRIAEQETNEDSSWLIETCARTFVLVFLALLGLLALGMLYGNVLGATNLASH